MSFDPKQTADNIITIQEQINKAMYDAGYTAGMERAASIAEEYGLYTELHSTPRNIVAAIREEIEE